MRFDVLGDGNCDAARFSYMCERSEVWQDAGEQLAIQAEANEEAEAARQQLINKANALQQQSSSAPDVRDNMENYENTY